MKQKIITIIALLYSGIVTAQLKEVYKNADSSINFAIPAKSITPDSSNEISLLNSLFNSQTKPDIKLQRITTQLYGC